MKKSNNVLYVVLFIVSAFCCIASLFFDPTNKAFTMLASIGCSGIVSVLVAWLLERSNERIQRVKEKELLDCLFDGFDLGVHCEMQRALSICSRFDELDINKEYTIDEISEFLKKLPADHVYFKGLPDAIEKFMRSISPSVLLGFSKNETGITLYSLITVLQNYINTLHILEDNEAASNIFQLFGVEIISVLEQINKIRGVDRKYSVSEDSKKFIIAMRAAKAKKVTGQ